MIMKATTAVLQIRRPRFSLCFRRNDDHSPDVTDAYCVANLPVNKTEISVASRFLQPSMQCDERKGRVCGLTTTTTTPVVVTIAAHPR